MFSSSRHTKITVLRYTNQGLKPVTARNRRKRGTKRPPAELTLRRLKKKQVEAQGDYAPILAMCYCALFTFCCMLGAMFVF